MIVIDPSGRVIYNGAIDNKPTTFAADLAGATNYVDQALGEALAGRPAPVPTSIPYGCEVHYASR
jgi:hypothetical protein